MDFTGFEKLNISQRSGSRLGSDAMFVTLRKSGYQLSMSVSLSRASGLSPGDRVDLYRNGTVYALRKASCGCLTLRGRRREDAERLGEREKGLHVSSVQAYLSVAPFAGGRTRFKAWFEDDAILFDISEEVNEHGLQ